MKRILDPKKIEAESFRIIEGLIPASEFPRREREVVKRVIHATTDLEYAKEIIFHPGAVESGLAAIRQGRDIVCDVGMVKTGINAGMLSVFGGKVICYINDADVIRTAARLKIARAIAAMRKSAKRLTGAIVCIGNAPTALFEVCDLVKQGAAQPALIIGIPVGFVGAADSKKELLSAGVPYITNSGTKGGSSVAAAMANALLKLAEEK